MSSNLSGLDLKVKVRGQVICRASECENSRKRPPGLFKVMQYPLNAKNLTRVWILVIWTSRSEVKFTVSGFWQNYIQSFFFSNLNLMKSQNDDSEYDMMMMKTAFAHWCFGLTLSDHEVWNSLSWKPRELLHALINMSLTVTSGFKILTSWWKMCTNATASSFNVHKALECH